MGHDLLARIDKRLQAVGLSESRAPKLAGMSDSAIRNLRRDLAAGKQRSMNAGTLERLAPVLRTTVQWLVTGTGAEDAQELPAARDSGPSIGHQWRNRLSEALKQAGKPPADIDARIGAPKGYLLNLTEGRGDPTLEELDAICSALDINLAALLIGIDVTEKHAEMLRLLLSIPLGTQEAVLTILRELPHKN